MTLFIAFAVLHAINAEPGLYLVALVVWIAHVYFHW